MVYVCDNCDKQWSYHIKKCIFCGNDIRELSQTRYRVVGCTQVNIPCRHYRKVPYFSYLLEDKNGTLIARSCYEVFSIGDEINLKTNKPKDRCVGIIGTGQMGKQIAGYLLRYGYSAILKTRDPQDVDTLLSKFIGNLSRNSPPEQVEQYSKQVEITADYADLENCALIIEATPENLEIKREVFEKLSATCNRETIFASNTSSISIDAIASVTDRPEKCIGLHFFNPVSKMNLVEVVLGEYTSEDTKEKTIEFSKNLDKDAVVVKNSPGFIVNRLLLPQINEAVHLLEEGVATREDIDRAVTSGLNHPMGPFALADFIGIDVCISILETLNDALKDDKYTPADTFYNMLRDNQIGKKVGEGFYEY
jgi:3-hydroxybutyryl-CoA dehydrogenase